MRKYFQLIKTHFAVSVTYRSAQVFYLINDFITISSIIFLWFVIMQTQKKVGGYNFNELSLYYLLVPFFGGITFTSMSQKQGEEIRFGNFSNLLIKPFDAWIAMLTQELASKINYLVFIGPLYLLLITLAMLLGKLPFSLPAIFASLIFLMLGFFLQICMDFAITWLAFWMNDVWCFNHFKRVCFNILGGRRFPLDLFSPATRIFIEFLPFKFFYYVPISYFLGTRGLNHFFTDLSWLLSWTAGFLLLATFLWIKGLKKYEAYGN